MEALAGGTGLDPFHKSPNEPVSQAEPIRTGRHRSRSSASVNSNISLPLKLDTSPGSLAPRTGDYASSNVSATPPIHPLHIPTIEVTASSRSQSPDPFGFHLPDFPAPGSYSPDPVTTPVLSTGSLSVPPSPALSHPWMDPWQFPQEQDLHTGVTSPFSLDHDGLSPSRRSSLSSKAWGGLGSPAIGVSSKEEFYPYLQSQAQNSRDISGQNSMRQTPGGSQDYLSDGFMAGELSQQIENLGGLSFSSLDESRNFATGGYPSHPNHNFAFNEHNTSLSSNAFFKYIHPLYPFLDQDRHFEYLTLSNLGQLSESSSIDIPFTKAAFQVYMVQAIGARVLEHQNGVPCYFRDSYFSAATLSHSSFNKLESIHDIQAALLLLIYALYTRTPGIDVCLLKSTIMASCIRLEFHKPSNSVSATLLSYRGILAFLSAYVLDRTMSIALDIPFATCDSNIEIEALVAQLQASSPRIDHSPVDVATVGTTAKVSRLISIIHTVQKFSSRTHPRLATPFLSEASPSALSNWRSEIFHTLETLSSEFRSQKENQAPTRGMVEPNTETMHTLVELRIQEATLLLLHPSDQALTLNPFEKRTIISTSRSSIAIYQGLQASKELLPSVSVARSVYTCGEVLSLLQSVGNRTTDPDIKNCRALLESFSEVDIAKHLERRLCELQRAVRDGHS